MNIFLLCIAGYFGILLLLSFLTQRGRTNDDFYRGGRRSPWWAVAYGMVGASVSGVTFVSVPGMVQQSDMTYLQMCIGFVPGYILVALVLLPIYYRLNLITIYSFLRQRLGFQAYHAGAGFFVFSKLVGAAIRLYLVCSILQALIFQPLGIPFALTTSAALLLIWLYTRAGGIGTIVWSDCLQTTVLLVAVVLVGWQLCVQMQWSAADVWQTITQSPQSRIFEWNDISSRQYFWKQFLSGIFVVIVMTGLDQDMMQKNLTCRTLRESQRNMIVNGIFYLPVNMLFLSLGILLYAYATTHGIEAQGDQLLPSLCGKGALGFGAQICFVLGMVAAAFSSADSAMTSLTTSICVDLIGRPDDERLRRRIHPLVMLAMLVVILIVNQLGSTTVIDTIYTICGYTYGPLLGLFAFALLSHRVPRGSWVLPVCLTSPLLCFALDTLAQNCLNYHFGYELLMLNGLLTALGLFASSKRTDR